VALGSDGHPISSTKLLDLDGAFALAFTPRGDEMFVSTHFSGLIEGFAIGPDDAVSGTANLIIDGGFLPSWNGAHVSFGGMEITPVPEPSAWLIMVSASCVMGVGCLLHKKEAPAITSACDSVRMHMSTIGITSTLMRRAAPRRTRSSEYHGGFRC
jgi:hypothetical protein